MAYAASERKKLPFTLLWTFLKTSLNMGSGPPGIKSITFSVSLTVGSPSHLPAHRTGCDFGHWIHVKPHTTDCLRTWVSLSHQANYILLVLQSGDLPGAVIRRKKTIPEMKQEKLGDAVSSILLLLCPVRGAGGTESIFLSVPFCPSAASSSSDALCWLSHKLAFLFIILKLLFLVHLLSTLCVIKENRGAGEWIPPNEFFQRQLGKYLICWKKGKGERERWECQSQCHKPLLLPKAEVGEVPQPSQHFHRLQYNSTEHFVKPYSPTCTHATKALLMEKEQSSSSAAEVYSKEPSWNAVPFISFTFSSICTCRRKRLQGWEEFVPGYRAELWWLFVQTGFSSPTW